MFINTIQGLVGLLDRIITTVCYYAASNEKSCCYRLMYSNQL